MLFFIFILTFGALGDECQCDPYQYDLSIDYPEIGVNITEIIETSYGTLSYGEI